MTRRHPIPSALVPLGAAMVFVALLIPGCADAGDDGEMINNPEVGVQDRDQDRTNRP